MPKLIKKDVEHVAKLAMLNLDKKQLEKYQKQLSEVVNYVSELDEVDTKDTEPTSQTTGLETCVREDVAGQMETLTQDDALSGTEKVHNGYFVVPIILSERSDY